MPIVVVSQQGAGSFNHSLRPECFCKSNHSHGMQGECDEPINGARPSVPVIANWPDLSGDPLDPANSKRAHGGRIPGIAGLGLWRQQSCRATRSISNRSTDPGGSNSPRKTSNLSTSLIFQTQPIDIKPFQKASRSGHAAPPPLNSRQTRTGAPGCNPKSA
jgi:hypothetical protein